jgi:hypothetical protein
MNKKQKGESMKSKKIEDTIKNILPNNDRSKLINCSGDDFFKNKKGEKMYTRERIKEVVEECLEKGENE